MSEFNGSGHELKPLAFDDLAPREESFTLGGRRCVLTEATENVACQYRNVIVRSSRMTDGKVTGVDGIAEAQAVLVAGCLFEVFDHQGEEKRRPVTLLQVKAMPARVVKPIFDRALLISGLSEQRGQKEMEKEFEKLAGELASLSESSRDKVAWRDWMAATVNRACGVTPEVGPEEVQVKNSRSATADTSA